MNGINIGKNIAAIRAKRRVDAASDGLARTFERLSSGQRINRASDDAAGLAVATVLGARRRVFAQGLRNLNDAVSALNAEFQKLAEEYQRTISTTSFNGQSLLSTSNGAMTFQGGGNALRLNVLNTGTVEQGSGSYQQVTQVVQTPAVGGEFQLLVGDINSDGIDDVVGVSVTAYDGSFDVTINVVHGGTFSEYDLTAVVATDETTIQDFRIGFKAGSVVIAVDNGIGETKAGYFDFSAGRPSSFTENEDFMIDEGSSSVIGDFNGDGFDEYAEVSIDGSSFEVFRQTTVSAVSFEPLTQTSLEITGIGYARAAITALTELEDTLYRARGQIGASMNRLASANAVLGAQEVNYGQAEARIRDTDTATEVAGLTRWSILRDTSTAVLAQANQQGNIALQLLQPF